MRKVNITLKAYNIEIKRFFYPGDLSHKIYLSGVQFHYIKNILRFEINDEALVLNRDSMGHYIISEFTDKKICLELISLRPLAGASYKLILYQAILKREYMDYVVEKSGEIGVTEFVPVYTERCNNLKLKQNTIRRYNDLLIKGAIQGKHEFIPKLSEPVAIKDIYAINKQKLLFHEKQQKKNLPKIISNDVCFSIGPEGGFTAVEVDLLLSRGFQVVSPTNSILKAETAAIIFSGILKIMIDLN